MLLDRQEELANSCGPGLLALAILTVHGSVRRCYKKFDVSNSDAVQVDVMARQGRGGPITGSCLALASGIGVFHPDGDPHLGIRNPAQDFDERCSPSAMWQPAIAACRSY